MWISAAVLSQLDARAVQAEQRVTDLARELAVARAQLAAAQQRADLAQNNFEWARLRLNQLEGERAALLTHVLKFPIAAMTIERQDAAPGSGVPSVAGLSFDDVGDASAAALGIAHDVDGRVQYR